MTQARIYPYVASEPAYGSVGCEESSGGTASRVFLIAIRGGLLPPVFPGSSRLQRMRIIVADPSYGSESSWSDPVVGPLPEIAQPVRRSGHPSDRGKLRSRPVHGELLCDERGRFYEKLGRRVRPLQNLVTGPNRELLELMPMPEEPDGDDAGMGPQHGMAEPPASVAHGYTPADCAESRIPQNPSTPPKGLYRKLVSDPGLWRVVHWGDFKELLSGQIAHPERLRDVHRLPCYVQIYEALAAQPLESLAMAILGDTAQASQFRHLTPALASKLGLIEVIETHAAVPVYGRHQPGVLKPYERVFRLQVAHDPTKDAPVAQERAVFGADGREADRTTGRSSGPQEKPAGLKTRIPDRFLKPWEFKLSREEVLYDMHAGIGTLRAFTDWIRRLKNGLIARREYRKWQTLLQGKDADEQLWSVRPPSESWRRQSLREWVQRTLQLSGYDPHVMLTEWEVFWRRKGLK